MQEGHGDKVVLVLNKVDKTIPPADRILVWSEYYSLGYEHVIDISAKTGKHIDEVRYKIEDKIEELGLRKEEEIEEIENENEDENNKEDIE